MHNKQTIVHSQEVTPELNILFTESNDNPPTREYLIQTDNQNLQKNYKSLFYVEKFPIYSKREIINRWINNLISTDELKNLLK